MTMRLRLRPLALALLSTTLAAPAMAVPDDDAVADVQVGQVLGERYRLDEVLARRGNALTWLAFDQRLHQHLFDSANQPPGNHPITQMTYRHL